MVQYQYQYKLLYPMKYLNEPFLPYESLLDITILLITILLTFSI